MKQNYIYIYIYIWKYNELVLTNHICYKKTQWFPFHCFRLLQCLMWLHIYIYIYIYIYIFVTRRHNDFVCIVSVFYSALCDRYDLQSRSQNDRKWKNGRMLKPLIIVFNRVLEVKTKETQLSIIDTQGEVKLKTGNLLEARKSERPARNLFQFLFDWLRWWWCTSSRTIT